MVNPGSLTVCSRQSKMTRVVSGLPKKDLPKGIRLEVLCGINFKSRQMDINPLSSMSCNNNAVILLYIFRGLYFNDEKMVIRDMFEYDQQEKIKDSARQKRKQNYDLYKYDVYISFE